LLPVFHFIFDENCELVALALCREDGRVNLLQELTHYLHLTSDNLCPMRLRYTERFVLTALCLFLDYNRRIFPCWHFITNCWSYWQRFWR